MEGKRKRPRLASVKTGEYITPNTERERKILDLGYVRTFQEIERKPHLMELDDMAKRILCVDTLSGFPKVLSTRGKK